MKMQRITCLSGNCWWKVQTIIVCRRDVTVYANSAKEAKEKAQNGKGSKWQIPGDFYDKCENFN